MTALPQRQELASMITIARDDGARLEPACKEVGISVRTFERWTQESGQVRRDGRPEAARPIPSNKLSPEERAAVLATCMEPRFADMPPTQIVPILADEGVYKASESTIYRVLHENDAQHHRGRAQKRTPRKPATHVARAPNEVWCWDVTYLPSRVRGLFFYLFAVIDLYSRKLVAWEVHAAENGELAAELIERARWREKLAGKPLILHADNGAAQRSQTLRAKLQELSIEPSYSRPGVSDDNAYIESLFRTLKYVPAYPSAGFADLDEARAWTQRFVDWYNGQHRHRGIGFVTPNQRHSGESAAILARRREVYHAAREVNPSRWSRQIRRWSQPDHVALNKRQEVRKAA
jgi:putative transposase